MKFAEGRTFLNSTTPLRISYLGGGSDYEDFFKSNQGAVLGCTFDWFVNTNFMALPKISREQFRITYRLTESTNSIDEIQHPSVRESLRLLNVNTPLNIATMSSVQGGTGLGSSSSFAVGLLNGLSHLKGVPTSPDTLAHMAIKVERHILREDGGWQDQCHAAWGGFRRYRFNGSGIETDPVINDENILSEISSTHLMIWIGNESHSKLASQKTSQGIKSKKTINYLKLNAELAMVTSEKLMNCLELNVKKFLEIMSPAVVENWELKKSFSSLELSDKTIDLIALLKNYGLTTYKILGAGDRGFLLVLGDPNKIKEAINSNQFGFTFSPRLVNQGSQLKENYN